MWTSLEMKPATPNELHAEVFELADRLGLPITIHAGEAAGAGSIRSAVEKLRARRIGHGVRLNEDAEVKEIVRSRAIPLELCVISNVQTKAVPSMESAPHSGLFGQRRDGDGKYR